jgi:KUP system potassium uptake protein
VLGFGSSEGLAAAYGISVMGAMTVDTILAGIVAALLWRWNGILVAALFGTFLVVDLGFFLVTTLKVPEGGWLPLLIAAVAFIIIRTWRRGRAAVYQRNYQDALPIETFIERLGPSIQRVAGTAVFMTGNVKFVPPALLHNLKHNKVIHERVVLMTVVTEDEPRVAKDRSFTVEALGKRFHSVTARHGFMEEPNVPAALALCRSRGLDIDMMETSFILGRETLVPSPRSDLSPWEERLFIAMSATALSATTFFKIPPGRVVEVGAQIEV